VWQGCYKGLASRERMTSVPSGGEVFFGLKMGCVGMIGR
jgi:hypothetical protein